MNGELMERVLARIEKDPESLDMGSWLPIYSRCGTAMCIAGHTAAELGYTFDGHDVVGPDGVRHTGVYGIAQDALRITDMEAEELFMSTDVRSPAALRERVKEIFG